MFKFNMRDSVKCNVTGFAGVVTARTEYLNGCIQYCVKPTKLAKDGGMKDGEWFDELQLDLVKKTPGNKQKPTGGPQRDQAPKSPV